MFEIHEISALRGQIGVAPCPGRTGRYDQDLQVILAWRPALVLSMTETAELAESGAADLGPDLEKVGIDWFHLPIADFGVPSDQTLQDWPYAATAALRAVSGGDRVLIHCMGGCGRSGMTALRLLTEAGEGPDAALARLRRARPCAVETSAQEAWARAGAQR